ncbi:Uncharacterized protein FKW44_016516 [Caligus rogercresseyi]|uniref:Uncharacterized protein n=1 Tax=Caligus rogercresseyi TaxID=217165 RepID=A0A7T8H205_CALRO|nr:Uncharacterized protein FKW44_016516 [Caligus rogercresseyi]
MSLVFVASMPLIWYPEGFASMQPRTLKSCAPNFCPGFRQHFQTKKWCSKRMEHQPIQQNPPIIFCQRAPHFGIKKSSLHTALL